MESRKWLFALALCVCGPAGFAQQSTAQLTGLVTDASGAVVQNADVSVINEATGIKRDTLSNELGYYTVPLLPPGRYRITAAHPGFRPLTRSGITLEVNQAARVDLSLEVGAVAEAVEVVGDASPVDTQTATLKEVVDERRIRELPLNGRDATQLILLLPGVYGTTDTSGLRQGGSGRSIVQPGISSNGGRGNMVNYALDGAFHNDTYTNVSLAMPDPDALQEFSVQTNNFSAEYGRSAGAVVNAVTRSGTNSLHGSLFEFHRNNAVNARNFFASRDDGLKRHQFGGTLGGPVYIPRLYDGRDRTFFFVSEQETRQVQLPATSNVQVLTAAQRAGDFSGFDGTLTDPATGLPFPGNRISLGRLDPLTKNILDKIIPLPTEPDTGLLWFSVPNNNSERQIVAKVDHQFRASDTLSGRYFYNYFDQKAFDTPLVFATRPHRVTPSHNFSAAYTHIFSPALLNQVQFSLNRRSDVGTPVWNTGLADLGMTNVFTDRPHPTFVMNVTGAFSVETTETITTAPHAYTAADTLRWTKGRHQTSFGFEYRYQSLYKNYRWLLDPYPTFDGTFTGYGVADFFLGMPNSLTQSAFGEVGQLHLPSISAFAQDNIKVTPRLTVSLGIRYEPFVPYVDDGDRVSAFRPGAKSQVFVNAPVGLLFVGDPGVPRGGTESDLNNLAPRVGFAWSPFGNARTSIRGGYGIFYDSSPMSAIANVFQNVAPFGTRITLEPPPGPFSDPYAGHSPFPLPFPPPKDISFPEGLTAATYPTRFRTAYLQDWNLTIEHELFTNWVVRAAYAGSKGTGLLQGWELNPAYYIPGQSTRANIASRRPYSPAFESIEMVGSGSNSNYNSLQLTLDKRFGRNFSLLANYTFAKSIDYGSGAGTLWPDYSNPFDFSHDRGLSDFNHTHRFVASGLWQLPALSDYSALVRTLAGGWNLGGVLALQSGQPFSIRSGQDNSLSGVGLDRADLVGDPSRPAGVDPVRQWFNTKAFAQNATGTFGSSGRNILTGPAMQNVDFAVLKNFTLYEQAMLQFRAEFFNLFNHANFNLPANRLTQSTYGRITSALDPRILQFGLKFRF